MCVFSMGPILPRIQMALSQGKFMKIMMNTIQWIGLRENLQETIDFPIKYGAFL